jgi:hypothetical protein
MTPSQAEETARNRYNAVNDTYFSQDEIFKYLYDAELRLAVEGLTIEGLDTSTTTVASTRSYAFPTNAFAIKRVEYNGETLQLTDFREDDRLTLSNSTTTTTGTPRYYLVWNELIYLRPIPDAAQTLTVYSYDRPTLLTTASTAFSSDEQYHLYYVTFAVAQMALKDGNLSLYRVLMDEFERSVDKARKVRRRSKRQNSFGYVRDEEMLSQTIIGTV